MAKLKKLPIHPFFYLFVLWFVVCGRFVEFLNFAVVLAIHEYSHHFVAKKCGYTLNRFFIAPYGACLNYKEKQFERADEIKIALAGPVVNLFFAGVIIALWWIFPAIYTSTKPLVEQNVFLGAFNLLPAYPLDGGRVLVGLTSQKYGREKAVKFVKIFNIILALCFLVLFIISVFISFNPTFLLCSIFVMSGQFQDQYEAKYQNSFLQKKKVSSFAKPRFLIVKDELSFNQLLKKIDADCYTIFEIISSNGEHLSLTETQIINYCLKFNGNEKLESLFNLD